MVNTSFILITLTLSFFFFLSLDQSNSIIDQNELISLEQVYLKILHQETNSYEQPYRFNQLLHMREQLTHLTKLLLEENLFYLPYLLIPN
jgi:hypothetical protein